MRSAVDSELYVPVSRSVRLDILDVRSDITSMNTIQSCRTTIFESNQSDWF